jgi:hypothetical protein
MGLIDVKDSLMSRDSLDPTPIHDGILTVSCPPALPPWGHPRRRTRPSARSRPPIDTAVDEIRTKVPQK